MNDSQTGMMVLLDCGRTNGCVEIDEGRVRGKT